MPINIDGSVGITFPDSSSQTTAIVFAAGTAMLFAQTASPTGWTKSTTHNDKALRVVSGAASSGGTVAFSAAFANGLSAGNTTLTTTQIPSHTHTENATWYGYGSGGPPNSGSSTFGISATASGAAGGGGAHNHTLPSFAVQYVDVIIATKD